MSNYGIAFYAFMSGAKWQETKDKQILNDEGVVILPEEEFERMKRSLIKLEEMKQQLMAKGVDGVVHRFDGCGVASVHYNDPNGVPMAYFIPSEGLSAGDKVKIITIKKK